MHTTFPAYPDIVRALENGSPDRLFPGAADPARFARHAAALDVVEKAAREALGTPLPDLPWSKFRLFRDTGDRATFEKPFFARRVRLANLLAAILGGRDTDGALLAALEDAMWETCNEFTWSIPAHLWRAGPRERRMRDERHMLDLFSTETGFYLAEALHFLGDRVDARVAARVRAEIRDRILDSYLGPYETPWWAGGNNNWGAVCAGSIGAAFLYEERDPARLRAALVPVLGTMESFIDSFPEDGACEEGAGYWNYGFGYFALFADLLRDYTDGALDLFQAPGVRRIANFPQAVRLSGNRVASFSDGGRFWHHGGWLQALLRSRFPEIPESSGSIAPAPRFTKPGHLLRDFVFCDPATAAAPPPDAVSYLPDAQWLVVRRAPFAFAAQFGNNGVSHNHNDVGSFLLVDGDREGPMDLGRGIYTRQYFGPGRYSDDVLCCGSQGHSLPLVGGARQQPGREFRAAGVRLERAPGDSELVFSGDIAPAYGLPALRSLRRTFRVRPAEGAVSVEDAFDHEGGLPPSVERFIGYEKPILEGPGRARFGAFAVRFDPSFAAEVRSMAFRAPGTAGGLGGAETPVHALDVSVPAGTVSFRIEFFRP